MYIVQACTYICIYIYCTSLYLHICIMYKLGTYIYVCILYKLVLTYVYVQACICTFYKIVGLLYMRILYKLVLTYIFVDYTSFYSKSCALHKACTCRDVNCTSLYLHICIHTCKMNRQFHLYTFIISSCRFFCMEFYSVVFRLS